MLLVYVLGGVEFQVKSRKTIYIFFTQVEPLETSSA